MRKPAAWDGVGKKWKFSYTVLSLEMPHGGQAERQRDKSSPVSPSHSQPSSYALRLSPCFSPLPKSSGALLLAPFYFHPFFSHHMHGSVCKNGASRDSWNSGIPIAEENE